jgi:3-methyladenine DNA glycosylase AlkD
MLLVRTFFYMSSEELVKNIRDFCNANTNEDNIIKYSRYFRGGFHGYGVANMSQQQKAKELVKSKQLDLKKILEAAPYLIETNLYEESAIILLITKEFWKEYTKESFDIIAGWYSFGINNWAHADMMGMYILPLFVKREIIKMEDFKPWLSSQFKFQRRCVPVTFIKHFKANREENFTTYFKFLEPLMTDPEREVHQGMGWFLREAWKIQPETTEKFLMKWKNTCPRLIIQYATEKMDKSYKERFRKEK